MIVRKRHIQDRHTKGVVETMCFTDFLYNTLLCGSEAGEIVVVFVKSATIENVIQYS